MITMRSSFILLLPTAALAAVTTHTTIDSAASAAGFTQQMSSFGVDLFATADTPAAALQHAACVIDQYLCLLYTSPSPRD